MPVGKCHHTFDFNMPFLIRTCCQTINPPVFLGVPNIGYAGFARKLMEKVIIELSPPSVHSILTFYTVTSQHFGLEQLGTCL